MPSRHFNLNLVATRPFPLLAVAVLVTLSLTGSSCLEATDVPTGQPMPTGSMSAPGTSSPLRIAVLSVATDNVLVRYQTALDNKRCYALHHGFEFILDVNAYHDTHGRVPHWNRVPALKRLLPFYHWVVYMDADMLITNSTPSFIDVIAQSEAYAARRGQQPPHLILQDGMEINNGMFLMKASQWSMDFLDEWWELGERMANMTISVDVKDQPSMMELLLRHANLTRDPGVQPVESCAFDHPSDRCYTQFAACWWVSMARLGVPFGRRSSSFIHYWYFDEERQAATGLNMIYPSSLGNVLLYQTGKREFEFEAELRTISFNGGWYHPSRLWHPGAFTLHRVNEISGGAWGGPTVVWPDEVRDMFLPGVCPSGHWNLNVSSPVSLLGPPDNIWKGYIDTKPLYVESDPRRPNLDVGEDLTFILQVHRLAPGEDDSTMGPAVPLPFTLPANPKEMWSRWMDFVFLGGVKCAIDMLSEQHSTSIRQLALEFLSQLPPRTWPSPDDFEAARTSIVASAGSTVSPSLSSGGLDVEVDASANQSEGPASQ